MKKVKTDAFWERNTLFIKIPQPEIHGFPENTWIAVTGTPPGLKTVSSTHLFEALHEVGDPEIIAKLALLSKEVPPKEIEEAVVKKVKEELENVLG